MTSRARELGIPFDGVPGKWNSITDVHGVEVGYSTIVRDDPPANTGEVTVRTGVTAILPRGKFGVGRPCIAATHTLNGNGEMTGRAWINETGLINTPIAITNTHSVGDVHAGIISWMRDYAPESLVQWALPIVAETWDGYLNDINGQHVTREHVHAALSDATSGPIAEGNVGGGTGMNCYGFKGGTGTSSRRVDLGVEYTVGVLVQANHGSRKELVVRGLPLGSTSAVPCPIEQTPWLDNDRQRAPGGAGSIIVVVATDAPVLPQQLDAMLRRVPLGLARNGTTGSHFSGDIFVGFSTANDGIAGSNFPLEPFQPGQMQTLNFLPWGHIDALYEAVVFAVEEAVLNALVAARDMVGRDGHSSFALPHEEIRANF